MNAKILLCFSTLLPAGLLMAQPSVTAWDILGKGLNDKLPEHRREAITAMGSIGLDPDAIKALEHTLRDDDPTVRQTSAAALGQMKSTSSIPALKAAFDDPSGEVAYTAAKALWEMGDRSGETVLQDVLTGQQKSTGGVIDGAMRDAKSTMHNPRALAKIGLKEASGALLGPFSIGVTAAEELLKDGGAIGRALSATLLAQKCDARNLQLLDWGLKEDKNNGVKATIAKALGQCGNKDEIPRLEQYLSSSNQPLRFMAAAAIIRLSGPDAPKSADAPR